MPNITYQNILVDYADLYYGPVGTALPVFATGSASLKADFDAAAGWTYLGATQDGAELAYEPDYGEVEVDQVKGPAKIFHQNQTLTVSTNLAEATLEHLLLAWGFPTSALVTSGQMDTFTIGDPGTNPVERAIALVGKGAPTTADNTAADVERDRVYHAFRVASMEGSTLALRKTEATVFPVTFRLLPLNDGTFGEIIDRVPGSTNA